MIVTPDILSAFLRRHPAAVHVAVDTVKGSGPREAGAWMLVSKDAMIGTIGGGRMEFMAIERARGMLEDGESRCEFNVRLGPQSGQCCGGNIALVLKRATPATAESLAARIGSEISAWPQVYLFGAGHVGRALAHALALLPVGLHVVETRETELRGLPAGIATELTPLPEAVVDAAPAGAAFVTMTHEHALDFLIARAALERRDAAYVGMIGSKTKRATFEAEYRREGGDPQDCRRLVCPVGGKLADKRPEVIAALVAAELSTALFEYRR